jgi:UDP-2,3-diacylglucosamine pyrophosphatase LpxH
MVQKNSKASKAKVKTHTLIISDVHLGSPMCQARELLELLENVEVKYLILNGDIFDDLRFQRLGHWDWAVFSQFRKMSDHCQVIWNRGNHDIIHEGFMSCLLGVKVTNGFYWHIGEKRMYALHGDRWDVFIYKYKLITDIATWFYNKLQEANMGLAKKITRWVKRRSKMLVKNNTAVKLGALKLAKDSALHGIFCGHTHHAELSSDNGIVYGNSGTFESDIPSYLAIHEDKVQLCRWQNGKSTILAEQLL